MAKTTGKKNDSATPLPKKARKKRSKPVKHAVKKENDAVASKKKPSSNNTVRKRQSKMDSTAKPTAVVPYTLEKSSKALLWPSTIFYHGALYPKGILTSPSNDNNSRTLTEEEATLWCQKHAGHTAAARRFPVEVGRLLGTITLEIHEKKGTRKKGTKKFKSDPNAHVPATLRDLEAKLAKKLTKPMSLAEMRQRQQRQERQKYVKKISQKLAADEAVAELPPGTPRQEILKRSLEIMEQWKPIQNSEPFPETWNIKDGSYQQLGAHDDQFVTLKALQQWLAKGMDAGTLVDPQQDATRLLYNGLTRVPIDATDILEALVAMANPSDCVYGVPLMTAYPRMTQGASKKGVWRIQLGVYMHRLLPEIFTCQSLHIVMSALDEGSFSISQPLSLPPTGKPVFKSAPYPRVNTRVLEDGGGGDSDSQSSSDSSSVEIIDDVDSMEGGSRDELVISPFSVKGLLKLLENKGCDVSNWPQIEHELQGKFQLDLLLHQKHAIAWMMQMEHLQGAYGINSLLWEERTFPDGGHYYYSPALGQVRLGAPPPRMKGGLLCDEQGLGKTVEVLGLIMATLSELKQRLDKKKHATTKFDGDEYYSAASSDNDEEEYVAHSTLIIVPPALLAQWLHEIEKAVGKTTLTVSTLVANTGELKQSLPPPADKGSASEDDDEDDWDRVLASDVVLTTYDALDKSGCQRVLQSVQWGRVVLDEMQEIRSSTTKIAKNCEKLQCDRRWMLSGTPIYQGIEDLRGELNFLRLEPFGANQEDGFFNFAIQTPWKDKNPHAVAVLQILGLVALRRSKDMTIAETGIGLLDLKPMTVEYIPVPQSHSERALYCWMEYLVACELELTNDAKKNKQQTMVFRTAGAEKANAKSRAQCLRLLRELCITPMLLNGGLGASSQLGAINQLMTRHNQREHQRNALHSQLERDGDGGARNRANATKIMSCDQALRFLTQHQQVARTSEEFVTDQVLGGGRGVSNRDRAAECPETRYKDAKEDVANAEKTLSTLAKKRAKARWLLALELITTGQYSDGRTHKFSPIWKWRRVVCAALEKKGQTKETRKAENLEEVEKKLPAKGTRKTKNQAALEKKAQAKEAPKTKALLTRGWRPSETFLTDLHSKNSDFSWSHPHAVLVRNIPKEVYQKELATAMRDAAKRVPLAERELENCSAQLAKLEKSKDKSKKDHAKKTKELEAKRQQINEKMEEYKEHDSKLKLPTVVKVRERKHSHGFWQAIVQFDTEQHASFALNMCGRSLGVPVSSRRAVPHIKTLIDASKDKLDMASAELEVHPSPENKRNLTAVKKEAANMSLGLRIVASGNATTPSMDDEMAKKAGTDHAYILVSKAVGTQRSLAPRNASSLIASATATFEDYSTQELRLKTRISNGQNVMQMLHRVVTGKVSPQIAKLSAYDTLEALSSGEAETKTQCVICLGYLGQEGVEQALGRKRKRGDVAITMISCGHFYCTPCVRLLPPGDGCPACRKKFSLANDTILVDPDLKDEQEALRKEREAAKDIVREAGKLLTDSNGHLEAEMWRALYLAFDLPANASRLGSQQFPAIPKDVLSHLRATTGMRPNLRPGTCPPPGSAKGAGRNSKIEALLDDLPTKERCVVFSANRDCLQHLAAIFKDDKIGYQMLCTGQSTAELRDAVTNWESDGRGSTGQPPYPVLLVQAGPAAAGLTLTAASKMFIMEPFLRQEQEHQAYARLHRYSQKHKVSVKVYYTPVSVESRLLEWRKGGKSPLLASKDKDAEECNFEENTEVVIHDIMDSDDDESSESGSEYDEKDEDDVGDDGNHDIAQANFLLGLVD